jgi:hypothetical protein
MSTSLVFHLSRTYHTIPVSVNLGLSINNRWIKWYPTAPGTPYPHHSLSCNVVDGAQMLVMGGTFPNSTSCDVPSVFAFHNMDLGKDNPEGAKWALFSPNKTKYNVPSEIIAVVGGG